MPIYKEVNLERDKLNLSQASVGVLVSSYNGRVVRVEDISCGVVEGRLFANGKYGDYVIKRNDREVQLNCSSLRKFEVDCSPLPE